MYQNVELLSKCNEIVAFYQNKQESKKNENIPLLHKAFCNAVINNKDILCNAIRNTRNAKELADYMRNGSFAEDAVNDFVVQMFAATINSDIVNDYDGFVKQLYDILKLYNYDIRNFEQFTQVWSNEVMQQTMENINSRRLGIVEIGTGIGSETAKKLHGFLFGKATEITITIIWRNHSYGKKAGKLMRQYLGKGEFKSQKNVLANHVSEKITDYATELAQWGCAGYNDIYDTRIKMAEQLLPAYMEVIEK